MSFSNIICNYFSNQKENVSRELVADIKKVGAIIFKASFRQSKRFNMLKKCFQNSVNEKHLSGNTFSTCWNVTTAQIILKDKDDIDALCPTNSSPK